MPVSQQPIRDYTVNFAHNRTANQPPVHARTRFIHVRFGSDVNKLSLLILSFIADNQFATTGDIVKLPNGTYRVSARIPLAEISLYTDLLRNEQPVSVRVDYATEPAINQSIPLDNFSLFTGPEPLGEGTNDTSA